MTRIPTHDRDIIETALYLPMLLIILERDRKIFEQAPFKLKHPYIELVEETIKAVQKDLKEAKAYLRKENISLSKVKSDDSFTMYSFYYKGFEENHNYFNPRLRNRTEELLRYYLNKNPFSI